MPIEYDEKGKFFTNIIPKRPTRVMIRTRDQQITGELHVPPSERVIDELNRPEVFLAVTDVIVYDLAGAELYRSAFMSLNRANIVWLIPEHELANTDEGQDMP